MVATGIMRVPSRARQGHQQSAEIPPDELASQAHIRRMRMMIKLNNASKPREEKIQPFCPWKVSPNERRVQGG